MRAWIVVVGLAVAACDQPIATCEDDIAKEAWHAAVSSCERAYADGHAPRIGRLLATAYVRTDKLDNAESIANRLLATDQAPGAQFLLGEIANARGESELALQRYSLALAAHTASGDDRGRARAAYQLAGIAKERGRYSLAVEAQEIAYRSAERCGDRRMALYANIAGAIILRTSGDIVESEKAIERALAVATTPRDRAWVKFTQGLSYIDAELAPLAGPPLRDVLVLTDDPKLVGAARLNLALVERMSGHPSAALEELRLADEVGVEKFDSNVLRAQVAVDLGEHSYAAKLLGELALQPLRGQWTWVVPLWQGRNEEALGNAELAERHYREALAAAEQLRAQAGRLEPHVLVKLREIHERLVGVLARAGRWADALLVIARLDATTLSRAEPARDAAVLLDAWRDRELVVVVRGGDHAWRLDVHHGAITGADLGPADTLEQRAAALLANPDDRTLAASLGETLLGNGVRAGPLYVLLVGTISNAPLAALRIGDRLAVARVPLIRALGLTPRPASDPPTGPPVVLGDPRSSLPGAAAEARAVAAELGVEPLLGPAADRAAVEKAHGLLLHIASHAQTTPDGSKLVLAEAELGTDDIAALAGAPATVVLASCGSAAARDVGGWGSLASAFIAAGTNMVIATSWTIRDDTAARVVEELYRYDVAADPAAALARAQQALATRGDVPTREWAAFNVIGGPPSR